ncbi:MULTISPECIES: FAD-dependent oxidoreductase [unclassified Nocardia]|uniref:FAD-dependent oxidoreductase n=1 Tax=unclassified Nocardia TaxID=2637762 RepID=UPI0033B41483
MAYVITQRCCNDASCVADCPVDCIRPRPDEPRFATAEMLYIDPDTCIDCGACVDACPVDAVFAEDDLPDVLTGFADINAAYFRRHPLLPAADPVAPLRLPKDLGPLRVAIVGAGPAACYAAEELLRRCAAEIEIFDRLPTPWGLLRSGVAPDHRSTKAMTTRFEPVLDREAVGLHLNVEVGVHISHDELLADHHAVLYAVGASGDRTLDIPGEDLPGSHSATEFVAWYNGHPDYADRVFDLSGPRAVIIGNGNVALDVARVLTMPPDLLEGRTDIAEHALTALRASRITEVVLIGRRGPLQAAYTGPEFLALGHLDGVDVVVESTDLDLDPESRALLDDPAAEPSLRLKYSVAQQYSTSAGTPSHRRIVFRYLASPTALTGDGKVESVELVHNELTARDGRLRAEPTHRTETLTAGMVLRAVGYRGTAQPGLPFDPARGVIPNEHGRVVGSDGAPVDRVYVTGWIKRGPQGVIGTNRVDAQETVEAILSDFAAGRLSSPSGDRAALTELLDRRQPDRVGRDGWAAIDRAELAAGAAAGRPRVKLATRAALLAAACAPQQS